MPIQAVGNDRGIAIEINEFYLRYVTMDTRANRNRQSPTGLLDRARLPAHQAGGFISTTLGEGSARAYLSPRDIRHLRLKLTYFVPIYMFP